MQFIKILLKPFCSILRSCSLPVEGLLTEANHCLQCFKVVPAIVPCKPLCTTPLAFELAMKLWAGNDAVIPKISLPRELGEHSSTPRIAVCAVGHHALFLSEAAIAQRKRQWSFAMHEVACFVCTLCSQPVEVDQRDTASNENTARQPEDTVLIRIGILSLL